MRRRRPPRPRAPRLPPGGRRPGSPGGRPHAVLVAASAALYLAVLWLGVAVIGDTPSRSALVAGLIVAIAATGYVFTRPPAPPRG